MGSDKPHPVSHVAYGYGACVATIDEKNFVSKMDVAFDVGRVINPKACEGQVEGGTLMGMGYGVTEDFKMDNGRVVTKYGTLGYSERNSGRTLPYILLKGYAGPNGVRSERDWRNCQHSDGSGYIQCIPSY